MRAFDAVGIATLLIVSVAAPAASQPRLPSASQVLDRVATETSVQTVTPGPGGQVVLDLEVRPNRGIRVFAPGAKNFVAAIVILDKPKGVKAGKPSYDIPDYEKNPGNDKRVPMFKRSFNIRHTVNIDKNVKPGTVIPVNGILTYQTCDERVVYPKRALPVRWTIRVAQTE